MNRFELFIIKNIIRYLFIKRLGYIPNLKNPRTYNEKIQWLKLNNFIHDQKVAERSDKYLVRDFIEEKGYGECLIKLFGVWDQPDDIQWEILPNRFILKLSNGSGPDYRWFVKDKSRFDKTQFSNQAKKKLKAGYGYWKGEFQYGKIPVKIIAEEYLLDGEKPIKDYKFYCFHGQVVFFSVEIGKLTGNHRREYYNKHWKKHPIAFRTDPPSPDPPFEQPDNFKHMIKIAEELSHGYPHIRVDLYNIKGEIYFGELTYASSSGIAQWKPKFLDIEYGNKMDLTKIDH